MNKVTAKKVITKTEGKLSDYQRVARAIEFLNNNLQQQPSLQELSHHLALSPYHLQRLFSRWAGISPKRFLQLLTLQQAKHSLQGSTIPVLDAAESVGLSSSSRLYDHFVQLEAITPGEYKTRGSGLVIEYGVHETYFGNTFIAITERGICQLSFQDGSTEDNLKSLEQNWSNATIRHNPKHTASVISGIFDKQPTEKPLSLYVKGTNFQINVWRALMEIQPATTTSYGELARKTGNPNASRAIGSAVGANPVALLIPCHRVIRSNGGLGGYRWGLTRKTAILAHEYSAQPHISR